MTVFLYFHHLLISHRWCSEIHMRVIYTTANFLLFHIFGIGISGISQAGCCWKVYIGSCGCQQNTKNLCGSIFSRYGKIWYGKSANVKIPGCVHVSFVWHFWFVTARIRRMGEGNLFSLFTREGCYPRLSQWYSSLPSPSPRSGVPSLPLRLPALASMGYPPPSLDRARTVVRHGR